MYIYTYIYINKKEAMCMTVLDVILGDSELKVSSYEIFEQFQVLRTYFTVRPSHNLLKNWGHIEDMQAAFVYSALFDYFRSAILILPH